MISRRGAVSLLTSAFWSRAEASSSSAFSFAVLADIQFADQDTAGVRQYRESLPKLRAAVEALKTQHAEFTIQLGDLIDGGADNLDRILPLFRQCPSPHYHVLGNHDFFAERVRVLNRFGLQNSYYEFRLHGWHFVVLDGMQVSVRGGWPEDSENYREGRRLLAELKKQQATNAYDWNGALGPVQREWLQRVLTQAAGRKERSIVFCHFPVLPESCRPEHLLWDYREVLKVIDAQPSVAAYINGHDHRGGYAVHNGIHFVTLAGVVEHDLQQSLYTVDLRPDHFVLRTQAKQDRYSLRSLPRSAR